MSQVASVGIGHFPKCCSGVGAGLINATRAQDDALAMIKHLASIALLSLPLSLLSLDAASADCTTVAGVQLTCSSPPPSSSSQPASSSPSSSPSAPPPAQPAGPGHIAEAPGAAGRLLELVNAERSSRGLGALSVRADVISIANPHSSAMASKRGIWHNDGYFSSGTRNGLRAKLLGENVAMNSSVDDAHRRLMNSPAHRNNILDGRFTQAGFSVVHDEAGTLYVTQNFMTPADAGTTASPAPAKKKASIKASRSTKKKPARIRSTRRARPVRR